MHTIEPERGKCRRVTAGADTELKPAVRQQVEHRRILRHPDGVFQRQRHDASAEANAGSLCRDKAEKGKGRRKPALRLMKMVLRDPCGIQPHSLRVKDL